MSAHPARFNWNVFPSTKLEASQMLTPLGCMYTPLSPATLLAHGEVIRCSLCSAVINHHVKVDRVNEMWWCPLCSKMSYFPDSFKLPPKGTGDDDLPGEIRPTPHGTVDYILPRDISAASESQPYVAAYVIDTYQHTDTLELREFDTLKNLVADSLRLLPENSLVLLVTFSDVVEIHVPAQKTSVVFLPELLFLEKYDYGKIFKDGRLTEKILEKLLVPGRLSGSIEESSLYMGGFLAPNLSDLRDYVRSLKLKLTHSFKPPRATGLAIYMLSLLLSSASFTGLVGKVNVFCSGPATSNPGKIVDELSPLRSHHDVANFNAPHFVAASKFYQTLSYISTGYSIDDAQTAVYTSSGKIVSYTVPKGAPRYTFDIYTGSLDQVGAYEMKSLALAGSGNIVLTDEFDSPRFAQHLRENTLNILKVKHNATLSVATSNGLKVMKAVCTGTELQSTYQLEKHTALHHEKISDTVTQFDSSMKKKNFTNQWYLGDVNTNDTVAIYFEPETASSSSLLDENNGAREVYVQFETKYHDLESGNTCLRVTTVKKITTLKILAENKVKLSNNTWRLVNTKSSILKEKALLESFDYKAWLVLFTRLLISKIDTTIGYESFEEVVNDVDSALIRLTKFFGGLQVDARSAQNPYDSLSLIYSISESFKELPALSYSLRRNPQLIRIFNSSPDETAYYHHLFNKSETETSCTMIHPRFYKIGSGNELELLSLNVTSLDSLTKSLQYFVLDSIFNVIIFFQYSEPQDKLPLHNSNNDDLIYGDSGIESLDNALEVVTTKLIAGRSIIPRIVLTQTGHSQARFLLARLYPVFDKVDSEEPRASSWWQFFSKLTPSNTNLMTDDVSVNKYYEELLEKVQNYLIEADY